MTSVIFSELRATDHTRFLKEKPEIDISWISQESGKWFQASEARYKNMWKWSITKTLAGLLIFAVHFTLLYPCSFFICDWLTHLCFSYLFKYYFSFGVTGNCTTPSLWVSKANYPSQLELLARHFFPEGVKFPFYVPITKKRSRFLAENEELEIQLFSFHFLGVIFMIIDFISTASLSRQHDLSGFYFKPT